MWFTALYLSIEHGGGKTAWGPHLVSTAQCLGATASRISVNNPRLPQIFAFKSIRLQFSSIYISICSLMPPQFIISHNCQVSTETDSSANYIWTLAISNTYNDRILQAIYFKCTAQDKYIVYKNIYKNVSYSILFVSLWVSEENEIFIA